MTVSIQNLVANIRDVSVTANASTVNVSAPVKYSGVVSGGAALSLSIEGPLWDATTTPPPQRAGEQSSLSLGYLVQLSVEAGHYSDLSLTYSLHLEPDKGIFSSALVSSLAIRRQGILKASLALLNSYMHTVFDKGIFSSALVSSLAIRRQEILKASTISNNSLSSSSISSARTSIVSAGSAWVPLISKAVSSSYSLASIVNFVNERLQVLNSDTSINSNSFASASLASSSNATLNTAYTLAAGLAVSSNGLAISTLAITASPRISSSYSLASIVNFVNGRLQVLNSNTSINSVIDILALKTIISAATIGYINVKSVASTPTQTLLSAISSTTITGAVTRNTGLGIISLGTIIYSDYFSQPFYVDVTYHGATIPF